MASPKLERITRQIVKNLPPIPRFRRAHFPIVRRATSASIVTRLTSLEIFNPETDDLDSDSSEPSSPDSIDSVISCPRPVKDTAEQTDSTNSATNKPVNEEEMRLLDSSSSDDNNLSRQNLVEFAEKLSAQLLKELNEDKDSNTNENTSDSHVSDNSKCNEKTVGRISDDPFAKKLNGEVRDLNSLREELRERRLMLANLISTSTANSTIQEEDESPKTPKSPDLSARSSNDLSLLIEEEGEYEAEKEDRPKKSGLIGAEKKLVLRADSIDEQMSHDISSIINSNDNLNVSLSSQPSSTSNIYVAALDKNSLDKCRLSGGPSIESRQSLDSWPHSNSTTSLDSPSVGGSSTHHRYYHVFREGELDALINHHVSNLHIVSSYYERASWCVVAEKVQVWTI